MKMICPKCGKEYNEKMTCCISCGADLVPSETEQAVTEQEQEPFEPIIPEAAYKKTDKPRPVYEKADFVRELSGHSPVPVGVYGELPSELPEVEIIPIKERTRPTLSGAAKFAGSLTASLLMLGFILLFSAAVTVRLITSESKIARFTESLDVMNLPASEASIPAEGYGAAEDATVQEAIYAMSQGTGLSREDIKNIYEASTVRSFITAQLTEYAEFIRSGKIPEKLTADKLKSVFSENIGVIGGAMDVPLSQHDINLAFSEIDSVQPVLDRLSPTSLENMLGDDGITALRLLSSVPVIVTAAALAASMLPLLRAMNRKTAPMLKWGGSALLAGGAAVSAAVFLLTVRPVSAADKLLSSAAQCAAEVIAPDLYRIAGALAVLGAVMLIWGKSLKKLIQN